MVCRSTSPFTKIIVFFRNYTKLADLAFLFYFVSKSKINSSKKFTSNWDCTCNPRTVTPHVFIYFHALTTELTWQVLIEGYLTSLVLVQLTFEVRINKKTQRDKSVLLNNNRFLLARLESAYSLIWGSHKIWGKGGGDTLDLL